MGNVILQTACQQPLYDKISAYKQSHNSVLGLMLGPFFCLLLWIVFSQEKHIHPKIKTVYQDILRFFGGASPTAVAVWSVG